MQRNQDQPTFCQPLSISLFQVCYKVGNYCLIIIGTVPDKRTWFGGILLENLQ